MYENRPVQPPWTVHFGPRPSTLDLTPQIKRESCDNYKRSNQGIFIQEYQRYTISLSIFYCTNDQADSAFS